MSGTNVNIEYLEVFPGNKVTISGSINSREFFTSFRVGEPATSRILNDTPIEGLVVDITLDHIVICDHRETLIYSFNDFIWNNYDS